MLRKYVDFDIGIERVAGGYVTSVRGPLPELVRAPFIMPFEPTELAQFMVAVGPPRATSRRLVPLASRVVDVKEYGRRLGDALLAGAVGDAFRSQLAAARQENSDVRVRLALGDVPELEPIPWEYLYVATLGRFLTLSSKTPLVRLLDAFEVSPAVSVSGALRVLVMISSPREMARLAVDREEQLLRATTGDLVASGQIELVVLRDATLRGLQRALLDEFHVFHFIGHGGFDRDLQEGVLALEREDGSVHKVEGERLGTLLHDAVGMQLAVLNACEGARSSGRDAFSGVAQSLVQQGLPAVVAMQTEISDRAALVFSHELYYFLTRGLGIDAAMCEVRKAMAVADGASEWGTAVLLRSGSDQPFSFTSAGAVAADRADRWDSLLSAAHAALDAADTATALPLLEQLATERPDDTEVGHLIDQIRQSTSGPSSNSDQPADESSASHLPSLPSGTTASPEAARTEARPPSPSTRTSTEAALGQHPRRSTPNSRGMRLATAGGVGLLVILAAVGIARPDVLPWHDSPTTSNLPPTAGISKVIDLPASGRPTGEVVLPYAFSGTLHLGDGTATKLQPAGPVADVLLVNDATTVSGNAVVSGDLGSRLQGTGGKILADLGAAGRTILNQDGSKFAFVDFNGSDTSGMADYSIAVMNGGGKRVNTLPHTMGRNSDPNVVGFVDDTVFYTLDGATWRWDTASGETHPWRPEPMVAFNPTTRTGVGTGPKGCFAVFDVNQSSERASPFDCRGGELLGITSDGTQAIARSVSHDRVLLVPLAAGAKLIEFRLPAGQVFEQVGVKSPDRTAVLDVRTPEGDRLVSCRFDGLCNVLTETSPAPSGLNGPPAYILARY